MRTIVDEIQISKESFIYLDSDFVEKGLVFPVIREDEIDGIVINSGGSRAHPKSYTETGNCDYIIDSNLVELKELNSNTIFKNIDKILSFHKRKIIDIAPFAAWTHLKKNIYLDGIDFNEEDMKYLEDIMSSRISSIVKRASKQLQKSKEILGKNSDTMLWLFINNDHWINGIHAHKTICRSVMRNTKNIDYLVIHNVIFQKGAICNISTIFNIKTGEKVNWEDFPQFSRITDNINALRKNMMTEGFTENQSANPRRGEKNYAGWNVRWGYDDLDLTLEKLISPESNKNIPLAPLRDPYPDIFDTVIYQGSD